MKILATSDIHNNSAQMKWILEASAQADLLLLAGDLLAEGQGREEVAWWLRKIICPLAIASGNHDVMYGGPHWLHALRSPNRLIDQADTIVGIPVAALPWENENGDWHQNSLALCHSAASCQRPWIMLAHSVTPSGPTREAALFEDSITARLCWTGHTHIAACSGGWLNCGQTDFKVPNHAWIDWKTGICAVNVYHQGEMIPLKYSLPR